MQGKLPPLTRNFELAFYVRLLSEVQVARGRLAFAGKGRLSIVVSLRSTEIRHDFLPELKITVDARLVWIQSPWIKVCS